MVFGCSLVYGHVTKLLSYAYPSESLGESRAKILAPIVNVSFQAVMIHMQWSAASIRSGYANIERYRGVRNFIRPEELGLLRQQQTVCEIYAQQTGISRNVHLNRNQPIRRRQSHAVQISTQILGYS